MSDYRHSPPPAVATMPPRSALGQSNILSSVDNALNLAAKNMVWNQIRTRPRDNGVGYNGQHGAAISTPSRGNPHASPVKRGGSRHNVLFADEYAHHSQQRTTPHGHRSMHGLRRAGRPLTTEVRFWKADSPDAILKRSLGRFPARTGGRGGGGGAAGQSAVQAKHPNGSPIPSHHTPASAVDMEKDMFVKRFNKSKSRARQRHDIYDTNQTVLNLTSRMSPRQIASTSDGHAIMKQISMIQQGERINREMAFHLAAKRAASSPALSPNRTTTPRSTAAESTQRNDAGARDAAAHSAARSGARKGAGLTRWFKTGPKGAAYYVQPSGRRQYYARR